MARKLPKSVVSAIELAIETAQNNGKKPDMAGIAAIFNTTYTSVTFIRRRMIRFARTGIDDRKKPGPKPAIENQEEIAESLKGMIEREPKLDQKAISEWLQKEWGIKLGQSSISSFMKRNAVPHKQSNRFNRKSKLVVTEGFPVKRQKRKEDSSEREEMAASALAQLLSPEISRSYRSPYPPSLAQTPDEMDFNVPELGDPAQDFHCSPHSRQWRYS